MIGSIYIWGNMSLYLISYLRETNILIVASDGTFLMPLVQLGICFLGSIGGVLEAKFGAKKWYKIIIRVVFLGTLVFLLGNYCIYLSKQLYLIYIGMFIYGSGIGLNVRKLNII